MSAETVPKGYHKPKREIALYHPGFDVPPPKLEPTRAAPVRLFPRGRGVDWDGEVA